MENSENMYIVNKKRGWWYVHKKGFHNIPVLGSFTKSRREAEEFAAGLMKMTLLEYRALLK